LERTVAAADPLRRRLSTMTPFSQCGPLLATRVNYVFLVPVFDREAGLKTPE